MNLITRLEILNNSGVICDKTKDEMCRIIEMFYDKHGITLTEENGAMMTTHLSMAIMRVRKNEPIKPLDEAVFQEILESKFLEKASIIYNDLTKILDVVLPENEKKYMLVNICVILEGI